MHSFLNLPQFFIPTSQIDFQSITQSPKRFNVFFERAAYQGLFLHSKQYNQCAFSMRLRVQTNRHFTSISEFSFIREIGVGTFGSVKLALHLQTNKCYAVKIVQLGEAAGQNEMLLLQRQINLHSKVDHPHVVKLWDTLIEEGCVYMVMELAENGTLFSHQNKHRIFGEAEGFKYFSQTLSAISYLHSRDIMHRDIKPQNILLDSTNNVKICDLGWATDNIYMKRKTFCGTYEYMAPEMVMEREYDCSIDVWALGVLLYELLHGYAPFPASTFQEMRQQINQGRFEVSNNFSKDLKELILDLLQFDPEQRPSVDIIQTHPWMERMRREIRAEVSKIKKQMQGEPSKRGKVNREKGSQVASKKHKRLDSLANQAQKVFQSTQTTQFSNFTQIEEKKLKKKCKTQGQESMQKLISQTRTLLNNKSILKAKENSNANIKSSYNMLKESHSHVKMGSEISKYSSMLFPSASNSKMKRMVDKLNDLTNKYPQEKKKQRLKSQKDNLP